MDSLSKIWDEQSNKYAYREFSFDDCWLKPSFLPSPGDRVLDAGCGAGTYLRLFSKITADLTGMDISPKMIEAAKHHGNCVLGDVRHIDFPDRSFDYVLSFLAVSHCGNPSLAFQELSRVLRPRGRLVLVLPNVFSFLSIERSLMIRIGKYTLGDCEHYTRSEISRKLKSAGLKVTESYTFTRRPECSSFFRQGFALPAYFCDQAGNRMFSRFWGECLAIQAEKE